MQIYVQTRDGKKTLYKSCRFGTAGDLKIRIGRLLGVPMGFSRLVFKKKILSNSVQLEEIGVKQMSTLELYWEPVICTEKRLRELELEEEMKELEGHNVHEHMSESYDHMLKTGGISRSRLCCLEHHLPLPLPLPLAKVESESSPIAPAASDTELVGHPGGSTKSLQSLEYDEKDLEVYSDLSDDELDLLAIFRQKSDRKSFDELPFKDEPMHDQAEGGVAISSTVLGLIPDLDMEPEKEPEESQDWSELEKRKESQDWSKLEERKESPELKQPNELETWDEIYGDHDSSDPDNEKIIESPH
ncbi:uncharacterized protein LOC111068697 [Drosophila obscura]|uniref:uncharacterized protein LOC111068697 n=1 Tax=Drosophila obscura TaxID=7282 RepID=UPI001BB2C88B|nr:uncharacterized protein LOC111068697 [Drosophila obscura]